jgi:hypothetical protein
MDLQEAARRRAWEKLLDATEEVLRRDELPVETDGQFRRMRAAFARSAGRPPLQAARIPRRGPAARGPSGRG